MSPRLVALLAAFLAPVAAAAKIDVTAFRAAREADPRARFDWSLFGLRVADGALAGLVAAGVVAMGADR